MSTQNQKTQFITTGRGSYTFNSGDTLELNHNNKSYAHKRNGNWINSIPPMVVGMVQKKQVNPYPLTFEVE